MTDEPTLLVQNIGDSELQFLNYDNSGPCILLLHAAGFLPWLWHPVARRLCSHYRVVAPYFCDHRDSDLNAGGLSWMQMAEDLYRLCDRIEPDRLFVVGHSMGASVATLAEAACGPRAEAMILIEPIYMPAPFYEAPGRVETHPLAAKALKRKNRWQSRDEAKAYLKTKTLFSDWDSEVMALYTRYGMAESAGGGIELTCHPAREAALFLGGQNRNPWPELGRIQCPVLVLEGENSGNRELIDLKKAATAFPNGRHRLVRGAGHLIPMEKPGEIAEIILDFIS